MILRVRVGSGAHGTSIGGQDDRDEMGICLEPAEFVTGWPACPTASTARARRSSSSSTSGTPHGTAPGGVANRSGAGNLDVIVVSRLAAERFLGYLNAQKGAMTGETGAHTNRPERVAVHGYDTKYAMHALRLGLQGVEMLTTGRITLPAPEPHRAYLRSIRRGEVPLDEVVVAVSEAEAELTRLATSSSVPAEPDRAWVDDWLHRSHLAYWAATN